MVSGCCRSVRVEGADNTLSSAIEHVRVDHRRRHVRVAEAKKDKSLGPMDLRLLRPPTVIPASYRITQPIHEAGAGRFI